MESNEKNSYVIVDQIINNCKKEELTDDFINFIKYFCFALPEYKTWNANNLLWISKSLYDFSQHKDILQPKICIYNSGNKEYKNKTICGLIITDSPFIVDSLTEAMKSLNINPDCMINSIVPINRDKNGDRKNIKIFDEDRNKNELNDGDLKESIIHCSFERLTDNEILLLEQTLHEVLSAVRQCVDDWQDMMSNVNNSIDTLKKQNNKLIEKDVQKEVTEFLNWLTDKHFIFLGIQDFIIKKTNKEELDIEDGQVIGICKLEKFRSLLAINTTDFLSNIYITYSKVVSMVHRKVNMDLIILRIFLDEKKDHFIEKRIFGLFSSIVYYIDILTIPIIRQKVEYIAKKTRFLNGGHNYKLLIAILQDFPRAELLHANQDELYTFCMEIISLYSRPQVKILISNDYVGMFVRCIIFIPRSIFSTALWLSIQEIIIEECQGVAVTEHIKASSESDIMRLQIIINVKNCCSDEQIKSIEEKVINIASNWYNNLQEFLVKTIGDGERLYRKYRKSFDINYQKNFSSFDAYSDIKRIELLNNNHKIEARFYILNEIFYLNVYVTNHYITFSEMIPVISNMGMKVVEHHVYEIENASLNNNLEIIHLHNFSLARQSSTCVDAIDIKENFEDAVVKIWNKETEDDYYNSLIVFAGLTWREVVILRAFGAYLKQIDFNYSQAYIQQVLAKYADSALFLIKMFHIKFDPNLFQNDSDRQKKIEFITNKTKRNIDNITILAEDKIISAILELNSSILRTNYYLNKSYISFKIDSANFSYIKKNKTFAEIYVYSQLFEGIHIRGSRISRGGLRWSDRVEDFRTEILGLQKAQTPKNVVIVPNGSKGGFILKHDALHDANFNLREFAVSSYKDFLRSMLDITDNVINGVSIPLKDIVCYDKEDKYLVVAADKGTATFSDYANGIAAEYKFWLGDAFASGGSSGYDHKVLAITSRGAWISVEHHFARLGINIANNSFTVVAIGDMAGDVCGNGLLMSRNMKVIAAFNHINIFIDPDPDLEISYNERKRLFDLPGSTWENYNFSCISKGGGVFKRSSKNIIITDEIAKLFNIEEKKLHPSELIKIILCSKVDLIWNGGIGTFIKSVNETNNVVGDKANDSLRVDGKDIEARIFAEGGNLGITQLGRIEMSSNGICLNTDFIDNSAGVSCSDMEVNLKILCSIAIDRGLLTIQNRDILLEKLKDEVCLMILEKINKRQNRAITFAELSDSCQVLEQYQNLINKLEKSCLLNRKMEYLPSNNEIIQMLKENRGFQRPQIALIIAYTKMYLNDRILDGELVQNEYFKKYLFNYFPLKIRNELRDIIEDHPLRNEIIGNYISNYIVNYSGPLLVARVVESTGLSEIEVVKIWFAIKDIYQLDQLFDKIEELELQIDMSLSEEMISKISLFMRKLCEWFYRNYSSSINVDLSIQEFFDDVVLLYENIDKIVDSETLKVYYKNNNLLAEKGVPIDIAKKIESLEIASSFLAIIQIYNRLRFYDRKQISLLSVARVYFLLGNNLSLPWLRERARSLESYSYWQHLSLNALFDSVSDLQANLTVTVIKSLDLCLELKEEGIVQEWIESNKRSIDHYQYFLSELQTSGRIDIDKLVVIIKYLERIRG